MKKTILSTFGLGFLFLLGACSGNTEENSTANQPEICTYSYHANATTMEWTAYKFTEKAPVKGTFTEMVVETIADVEDPMEVLKNMSFQIPVSSVSTQNEERDAKIIKHFFETIKTEKITGKITDISKADDLKFEINMNGMTVPCVGKYTFDGENFSFEATIDVASWNAMSGINALNTICKDLHTGTDKISKLWSEVGLSFSTKLVKTCK